MSIPTLRLETPASSLELDIWQSPGAAGIPRGCVILHPWSKLGGTMEDPTVVSLFRAAVDSGLFGTVCRYNMRGAGNSKAKWNKHMLEDSDVQDCVAVCMHVLTQVPDPPKELYIFGYSYGACVAASALEQVPEIVAYVAVGFPLGAMANLALNSRKHWSQLQMSDVPKLAVHGTRDNYSKLTILRDYAQQYHDYQPQPGPLDLVTVDGADHFFEGQWQEVAEKAMSWVHKQLEKQPGAA